MLAPPVPSRAGSRAWSWLAGFVVAVALAAGPADGQVKPDPARRDTVPGDTVRVPVPPGGMVPDTLPQDSLMQTGDSLRVVPPFPRFPDAAPVGFAFGRWEWDRAALRRYHGLSLLRLLERIPGLTLTRAGGPGAPAGISALAVGGARVRVLVDGFELDPLGDGTPDLQQVGLADLESVRVERDPGGVRILLNTLRLSGATPVSEVEVGTGTYQTKLLRGLLLRGIGSRSIVTAGYDLVSTAGAGFESPYQLNSARVAWSYALAPETGVQLEFRSSSTERTAAAIATDFSRRSLILRGRSALADGLVVDGMVGRTTFRPEEADPLDVELSSLQAAARAAYSLARGSVEATARLRSADRSATGLPRVELSARGVMQPLPWVTADAEVAHARALGAAGTWARGTVRVGPASGAALFATLAAGDRTVGLVRDSVRQEVRTGVANDGTESQDTVAVTEPVFDARSLSAGGLRIGAEWARGRALVGAAALAVPAGPVAPYGLRFDRTLAPVDAGAATGGELFASLPLPVARRAMRLDATLTAWTQTGGRPFVPSSEGRLALVFHDRFYDDQLEPSLRVEAVRRGGALAPQAGQDAAAVDAYHLLNLFLQIRILDVQAFLVWGNLLNEQAAQDVPGFARPYNQIMYGVRWTFQN